MPGGQVLRLAPDPPSADPFDPRTWEEPLPYQHIWLDRHGDFAAVVDEGDYADVMQFRWRLHYSSEVGRMFRAGKDVRRWLYATAELPCRLMGRRKTLLHRYIMRAVAPPSRNHVVVDHLNGQGLDCRRRNLRWATRHENGRNRFGIEALQQRLVLGGGA